MNKYYVVFSVLLVIFVATVCSALDIGVILVLKAAYYFTRIPPTVGVVYTTLPTTDDDVSPPSPPYLPEDVISSMNYLKVSSLRLE
ncbi:hypothetical protein L195_g050611 [Trifolium pratense]|uniref:Uncharacterized protein n=1 Tax=Trifolium pratense TaxID=57577 RepID=A0A2K3JV16_TRIPR|nr:hypothetical protein L195_g050611 [Trifolium pratense]